MIEDDLIRHQIYLQRRGAGIYNSILPELKAMRDKITARIANATPNELLKIKGMLKDLNSIIDGSFERIQPSLFKDFEELAVYEGEHALKMLDANTAATVTIGAGVNDAALIAMVGKSKMFLGDDETGKTIDDLITKFSDRYKKDIKSEIELGLLAGDTTDDIVKRIQSLSNGRTKEQAKAMILTIANHVGHQARSEVWEPYSDLFEGEEFNATLDGRTTLQCASLDLKVFPIGKGPQPPLHYRCRSIRVIKVKDQYSLGIDTTRSSMNGPVSSKLTYSGWLKGQSKEVQNEVLGVERAKLFRSGKITLDKFTDDKGKMYSLAQLKKADVIGTVKAVPKIEFGYGGKFDGYVADIRDEAKIVIDKLPKPDDMVVSKSGAYLRIVDTTTLVDDKGYGTFTHEYGHHIDNMLKKEKGFYSQQALFNASKLDSEFLSIDGFNDINEVLKQHRNAMFDFDFDTLIWNPKNDNQNIRFMSDIIDSLSDGKFMKFSGYGHGEKYYTSVENKMTENFANLFHLWSDGKNWKNAQSRFPNLTSEFEKIMKDIIDGKFD